MLHSIASSRPTVQHDVARKILYISSPRCYETPMRLGIITPLLAVGAVWQTSASLLPVTNPSFEDITGNPPFNEFTLVVPNGWSAYNPNSLVIGSGLYLGTLEETGAFFDVPPPDGDRVAILYNQNQKGNGEYGIQQTLADTLQPVTTYTLQVEVGNIGSGTAISGDSYDLSGFPGYRVDLLAGTTVLASDNNSLAISERQFALATVQFTTGDSHPLLGQPLAIRLVSLNSPFEPDDNSEPFDAHEVDFDFVTLDATSAVPEPTVLLLALLGGGLLVRRRRLPAS